MKIVIFENNLIIFLSFFFFFFLMHVKVGLLFITKFKGSLGFSYLI